MDHKIRRLIGLVAGTGLVVDILVWMWGDGDSCGRSIGAISVMPNGGISVRGFGDGTITMCLVIRIGDGGPMVNPEVNHESASSGSTFLSPKF